MGMSLEKISYIIPCYNSEKTISNVVKEIVKTVSEKKYEYEIILVNDGSKDNVLKTMKELLNNNKNIKAIDLIRNFGQHAAIMAGLNYSSGDIIVCLDDDGQTPADESLKLIEAIQKGADVAYARYNNKKHSLYRNLGSKINELMARAMLNKPKDLYLSSYFACKKNIVKEIIKYDGSFPYLAGLVLRTTDRVVNVDINHRKRESGKSGYSFKKLLSLWLNGFTAFSVKPLRLATFLGMVVSLFGLVYGLYLVFLKFNGKVTVEGYSCMMAAILFLGGVQMAMLGLIGEYIGRIYLNMNKQPQYIIRKTYNLEEE